MKLTFQPEYVKNTNLITSKP